MFLTIRKTAMSPIIHEVLDAGTGVTDRDGRLAGSGAGIPTFVGVLDKAVKRILSINGEAGIRDGDIFVTNDPAFGGVTHLSDVVVAMPVFLGEERIAWTASIAHWSDIGGLTPGSMSTKASEIFQEGLRLPAVHLFREGKAIQSLLDIIKVNSRLPEFALGDLWAQVAASRRGGKRIEALAERYGLQTFQLAVSSMFDEGERRARRGLRELPRGDYEIAEEQDNGETWTARINVSSERFLVDLRDNPAQKASPYNTSRDGAVISSQMIFKALADPGHFANEGSFRPLCVRTEPGTIFDATGNAPHGYYFETRIRLYEMLWRCMARRLPDRMPAGHFASICGTVIAGRHPDTGRRYTMVEPQIGGWGATAHRDGLDCMYSASHGETYCCPVEICEARYGLIVGWKRLSNGRFGSGRFRGGRGLSVSYRPREEATVAAGFSHSRIPAWGLNGGESGGTNQLKVVRSDGHVAEFAFVSDLRIAPGDELIIETADGGGWGHPLQQVPRE